MVTISKEKAKRLKIKDSERKGMSKNTLREAERKSGQYDERNGKTYLTDEAKKEFKPEQVREEIPVKTNAPIKLAPEKKGFVETVKESRQKAYDEHPLLTKVLEIGAATETGILAGLLSLGGSAGATAGSAGARAVITRTAQVGAKSMTTQRAFVGRATSEKAIEKLFSVSPKTAETAARFAVNTKAQGLTKSFFSKAGMSMGAAGIALGAIGSYPFANFIKEEAVQTLNIPIQTAIYNGDLEGAKNQIAAVEELINSQGTIMSKIPYANILEQLSKFFEAAEVSNNQWKRIINQIEVEGSVEEQRTKEEGNEMEWKAEYYKLIREKKFDEADELLKLNTNDGK